MPTCACHLVSLEFDEGKIHVLGHSPHMLQPIDMKPFLSSPAWVCGHFDTLEPKKPIIFIHVRAFLVIFRKIGCFSVGGPGENFLEKNFFFLLETNSQHVYGSTLEVSDQLQAI